MFCTVRGYDICHNSEEVIGRLAYDPDSDVENTADSVFCSHGAGIIIPWYEVGRTYACGEWCERNFIRAGTAACDSREAVRHTIELTQRNWMQFMCARRTL